jgi:predicted transcriptional regulator/ribosomal protein S18 acetylase RimI-like enzyme
MIYNGNMISHIIDTDCNTINCKAEIFNSLRNDYLNFNKWFLEKCVNEHRHCFAIYENSKLQGIAILKNENDVSEKINYRLVGKTLKICTFKISSSASGKQFGKMLLSNCFKYASSFSYHCIYVTAYKDNSICEFLQKYGFRRNSGIKSDTGEYVFVKYMDSDSSIHGIHSVYNYLSLFYWRREGAGMCEIEKNIFLSIRPEYVDKIKQNQKKIEFRKRKITRKLEHILIYETLPFGKIVGYAKIKCIVTCSPLELWNKYSKIGGISYIAYKNYYKNKSIAIGILWDTYIPLLNPISLDMFSLSPPQSYKYISDELFKKIVDPVQNIDSI